MIIAALTVAGLIAAAELVRRGAFADDQEVNQLHESGSSGWLLLFLVVTGGVTVTLLITGLAERLP